MKKEKTPKDYLEEGCIVVYNNDTVRIKFGNTLMRRESFANIDNFNENLEGKSSRNKVNKIYKLKENFFGCTIDKLLRENNPRLTSYCDLIWEREPETLEVTWEEVAEKFNVDPSKLKIKGE